MCVPRHLVAQDRGSGIHRRGMQHIMCVLEYLDTCTLSSTDQRVTHACKGMGCSTSDIYPDTSTGQREWHVKAWDVAHQTCTQIPRHLAAQDRESGVQGHGMWHIRRVPRYLDTWIPISTGQRACHAKEWDAAQWTYTQIPYTQIPRCVHGVDDR